MFKAQADRLLAETLDENECLKEEIERYKLMEAYLIARLKLDWGEE